MTINNLQSFETEYKELLKKYNVEMKMNHWADEWGEHINVVFVSDSDENKTIYRPEFKRPTKQFHFMGS
jgi:hypothetical protein